MGIREDYQAFMEKQLHEWNKQTERLKAGAAKIEEEAKTQYEKNLEVLHAKQKEAWDQFAKLKNSGDEAWEKFKVNMDKAGGDLKEAAERMTSQFKK
jgi:hypothetical protein